ncbi:MAG TPA: sigma-70 family RNA polymerase sigma factor [Isosphaeraceae bacterium]|nr:sigma-70 family RNA polymerase sigma factor [Isosphaeraceae bacterium]
MKNAVLRQIDTLFRVGTVAGLTDGQLLERFRAGEAEAAEVAFGALLERHGPMVLGVCKRVLNNPHDTEDAFQATFLVLLRRAGSIRSQDAVGHWLYGVARRVAIRAKQQAANRQTFDAATPEAADPRTSADRLEDEIALLHEEIARLPAQLRAPVVLCYLQGMSYEAAARCLRLTESSVRGRLARARERLRFRLSRRGVTHSMMALAASPEAVPHVLKEKLLQAATQLAAGRATAGIVSLPAAALAEGLLRSMFMTKLKWIAATLLVAGLVPTGLALTARGGSGAPQEPGAPPAAGHVQAPPDQAKPKPRDDVPDPFDSNVAHHLDGLNAETKMINYKLDQPVNMELPERTTLQEFLKHVKSISQGPADHGISIYVEPEGLRGTKLFENQAPVGPVSVKGVPLRTVLRMVLRNGDLSYVVKDGLLIIDSRLVIVDERLEQVERKLDRLLDEGSKSSMRLLGH